MRSRILTLPRWCPNNVHGLVTWFLLAVVLIPIPTSAEDAETWGVPTNGLRMSLSVTADRTAADRDIQIALQNVGGQDLLVQVGVILIGPGEKLPTMPTLHLKLPGQRPRQVVLHRPYVFDAHMEPWRILLHPGDRSTILRRPVNDYMVFKYAVGPPDMLPPFLRKRSDIWAELEQPNARCQSPDEPMPVPCWQGKVASNVLHFPRKANR
jgi:hypothetical protein